ncbi:MAG: NADH-quinone oxidoreductase subunit C [Candidatus Aenigmatarchaeota archaeon]
MSIESKIKRIGRPRLIAMICIEEGEFRLIYRFDKDGKMIDITQKIKKSNPVTNSISHIYPSAEMYEREIHDFFGIEFKGNKRLHERLFLPDNYKGMPPLRKEVKNA